MILLTEDRAGVLLSTMPSTSPSETVTTRGRIAHVRRGGIVVVELDGDGATYDSDLPRWVLPEGFVRGVEVEIEIKLKGSGGPHARAATELDDAQHDVASEAARLILEVK
jgi:hypothetical protein